MKIIKDKIEQAAIDKCGFISSEFCSGAKWAINEFLKNLWHPASEQPNIEGKPILFNCIDHDCVPSWCVYPIGFNGNWHYICSTYDSMLCRCSLCTIHNRVYEII